MRLVAILALLAASPAWAKPKPKPKAVSETDALIAKAEKLAADGDHTGAAATYKQAYFKDPKANTLLGQAMQLQDAGQEIEALDTFQGFLNHPDADRILWRKVQLVVADLVSRLGSLRIEIDRPADISVDGKFLGEGMLVATTRAMAGEHTIVAQRPGLPDTTHRTIVTGGEERVVQLKLDTKPRIAPPVVDRPPVVSEPPFEQDKLAPAPAFEDPAPMEVTPGTAGKDMDAALWLTARGETDLREGVIGPTLGIGVGLGSLIGLEAMALVQRATGMRLAASLRLLPNKKVRPVVRLGVPAFFEDGESTVGLHASAGALWEALPRVGLTGDLAVEHFFSPPGEIRSTVLLLSFGVQAGVM